MANTKQRHLEILAIAKKVLSDFGGTVRIDELSIEYRANLIREMDKMIETAASCHFNTAKRNLAKAMRQDRFRRMKDRELEDNWGGERPNQTGRPPKHK